MYFIFINNKYKEDISISRKILFFLLTLVNWFIIKYINPKDNNITSGFNIDQAVFPNINNSCTMQ